MSLTPQLLSLLVWLPFLLLAVVFGIVFGILGFKRGSIKAAISLAVTALSTFLSILLARALAGKLASSLTSMLGNMLGADGAALLEKEHFAALLAGCATAVGALLLFIPTFLLLLLLFKNLTSLVFTRKIPKAKCVGNKLGGLGLGLVDAFLVVFLLLLPLYGTLGMAGNLLALAPEAQAVSDGGDELSLPLMPLNADGAGMQPIGGANPNGFASRGEETPMYQELLSALCGNPLSKLAGTPLFTAIYDSMASFTYDGETVSVTKTLTSAANFVGAFTAYQNQGEAAAAGLITAFDALEDLLTESSFFAGLVCDLLDNPTEEGNATGAMSAMWAGYEGFSDKQTLRGDLSAVFTLARSLVNNGILSELLAGEPNLADLKLGTLPYDMADALNSTASLAKWKANLVNNAIDSLLNGMSSQEEEGGLNVEELKAILGKVSEAPLTGENKKAEGDALHLILNALLSAGKGEEFSSKLLGDVIEGLARHPAFGVTKVTQMAEILLTNMGAPGGTALVEAITKALTDAVSKPVGEASFGAFIEATMNAAEALQGIAGGETDPESMEQLLKTDSDTLLQVKDTLSADLMTSLGLDDTLAQQAETLFGSVFETIAESEFTDEEAAAEAEALSQALTLVTGAANQKGDDLTDVIPEPDTLLDTYLASSVLTDTISKITADSEKDPLGLFDQLGKDGKKEMANLIQEAHDSRVDTDTSVTEKLTDLAAFLGIDVKLG